MCGKLVQEEDHAIICTFCNTWYHQNCQDITDQEYAALEVVIDKISWYCITCRRDFVQLDEKIKAVGLSVEKLAKEIDNVKETSKIHSKKVEKTLNEHTSKFQTVDERLRSLEESVTVLKQGSQEEVLKKVQETTKKYEENTKKKHLEYTNSLYEKKNLEYKSSNIIISMMPEVNENNTKKRAKAEFKQLRDIYQGKVDDLIPEDIIYMKRLGERKDTPRLGGKKNPRLLLVRFKNLEMRKKLLKNNRDLKTASENEEQEQNVYVTLDRTNEQNKKLFDLRTEKKRRIEQGEEDLIIRNYRLVKKESVKPRFAEFFRDSSESENESQPS